MVHDIHHFVDFSLFGFEHFELFVILVLLRRALLIFDLQKLIVVSQIFEFLCVETTFLLFRFQSTFQVSISSFTFFQLPINILI